MLTPGTSEYFTISSRDVSQHRDCESDRDLGDRSAIHARRPAEARPIRAYRLLVDRVKPTAIFAARLELRELRKDLGIDDLQRGDRFVVPAKEFDERIAGQFQSVLIEGDVLVARKALGPQHRVLREGTRAHGNSLGRVQVNGFGMPNFFLHVESA